MSTTETPVDPTTDPAIEVEPEPGETPSNVTVGQFGAADPAPAPNITTGTWTCGECGELCNPTVYAVGVNQETCWKCGAPAPSPGVVVATPIDPAAIARDYDPQHAENLARAEEGLPPLPIRGTGKNFDADGAWADIHAISLEVDANQREVDELTKKRKSAVARLEDSQARFKRMVDHYYECKTKADEQPGLPLQVDTGCPVARELGTLCPACASAAAKFGQDPVPADDPLHFAHVQHADLAKSLLIKDRDELMAALRKKNFHLNPVEFATMPVGDLQVLQRYAVQTGIIPPPLLMWAHIAAAAGSDRQECRRCGTLLVSADDVAKGEEFYPTLAAVGLDCPGKPAELMAADFPEEPVGGAGQDLGDVLDGEPAEPDEQPIAAMPAEKCAGGIHAWTKPGGWESFPPPDTLCDCGTRPYGAPAPGKKKQKGRRR